MDKSFDFSSLCKKHAIKHKSIPKHLVNVASGMQKRLEINLKNRKSKRLTSFDSKRNLPKDEETPIKKSDAEIKGEHRRQQLEKWKKEKEMKKKEAATHKKKPFLVGVVSAPLKFVPPPPVKPVPSTSGMVTRSQVVRSNVNKRKADVKDVKIQSFAPKNATFKAPELKNDPIPILITTKKTDKKTHIIPFNPIKETVSKSLSKVDARITKAKDDVKTAKSNMKTVPRMTRSSKPVIQNSSSGSFIEINVRKIALPLQSSCSTDLSIEDNLESTSSSEMNQISERFIPERNNLQYTSSSDSNKSFEDIGKAKRTSRHSQMPKTKTPRMSTSRKSKMRTPKNPIPKSESSSEEKLRSPKDKDILKTPEQIIEEVKKISPFVTMSRGKDNARRELKKKLEEGLLDYDTCDMDTVDDFRHQLASEIKRLTEMCNTWDKISEQMQLPDTIQECVLSAVGQGRLLMSQKLQQFASLVERCARPEPGTALVTPADLHGFWDMVYMQVENVDLKFKKLEELRERGWVEEKPVEVKKRVASKPAGKKTATSNVGASRLKDMIAAARKAKKAQESATSDSTGSSESECKTFEAGFFSVKSPVRSPAVQTPSKPSLLKAVLSSEAKKASASKNSASFAILRASAMSKCMDCEGVALLPQTPVAAVNMNATPGRSILKSANQKSGKKSIKVVLFDKSDTSISMWDSETESREVGNTEENEETGLDGENNEVQVKAKCSVIEDPNVVVSEEVIPLVEKREEKKEIRRNTKLVRQDAVDERSPVMTRSRRKSMKTPLSDISNSERGRSGTFIDGEDTPKRSTRSRKSFVKC